MRTQAIILKKIPVREYDELVVCYTKDAGKQTYQAKSILRPSSKQAGHLDILNLVDFSLVQKNSSPRSSYGGAGHPIITSSYCLDTFRNLKSSLPALAAAYFLLECFDKLVFEGEPDAKLWDFLYSHLCEYDRLARLDSARLARLDSARFAREARRARLAKSGKTDWTAVIKSGREKLLGVMGYDPNIPIEQLANAHFKSLQFARKVVG